MTSRISLVFTTDLASPSTDLQCACATASTATRNQPAQQPPLHSRQNFTTPCTLPEPHVSKFIFTFSMVSFNVKPFPYPLPKQKLITPSQIFRILGDVSHTLSKCILIIAIHRNHSTEGVSLITQALYCLVFVSRYLDLFSKGAILWNTVLKVFYILSSLYILFLMMRVYARTREREKAWKFGAACLAGSAVFAPALMLIFRHKVREAGDVGRVWSLEEVRITLTSIFERLTGWYSAHISSRSSSNRHVSFHNFCFFDRPLYPQS